MKNKERYAIFKNRYKKLCEEFGLCIVKNSPDYPGDFIILDRDYDDCSNIAFKESIKEVLSDSKFDDWLEQEWENAPAEKSLDDIDRIFKRIAVEFMMMEKSTTETQLRKIMHNIKEIVND